MHFVAEDVQIQVARVNYDAPTQLCAVLVVAKFGRRRIKSLFGEIRDGASVGVRVVDPPQSDSPLETFELNTPTGYTDFEAACPSGSSMSTVEAYLISAGMLPPYQG